MLQWVLEEFDRGSGVPRARHRLTGPADFDVKTWLGASDLAADLYDVPNGVLREISVRFGIPVFPEALDYLLGRESMPEDEEGPQRQP